MSEARFETVLQELRETAPRAPERLRELVGALPAAPPRRTLRLRPALAAAIALALAVGLGAAIIGGATGPSKSVADSAAPERLLKKKPAGRITGGSTGESTYWARGMALAPTLTARSRLQRHDVFMSLRVDDLSGATQSAVRQTRRLGGYVASAHYSTEPRVGDSRLELRVPVQNLQKAIAFFTDMGTIQSQRISVADLQAGVDRIDRRIETARKVIAELEAKSFLTPDERAQLDKAKGTVKRLSRSRAGLVREGTYAKVSLQLTTRKPAAKQVAPGRFDRFWGNAGDILEKELIAVLYVLVVAGPFAILAALALLAERARRRRADHRLLEETG